MRQPAERFASPRTGHRLAVLFVLGILLPGIALAVFSARALIQERRLADQEIDERLQRVARLVAAELEQALRQHQRAVEEIAHSWTLGSEGLKPPTDTASWPEAIRQALEPGASGAIVFREGRRLGIFPPQQLLYWPATSPSRPPWNTGVRVVSGKTLIGLAEAELAELRAKDYAQAIRQYERLLPGAEPSQRPLLLHRLARTSRKAGLREQAFSYYRELEQAGEAPVGPLPAGLIAVYELCSMWAEEGATDELRMGARELYGGLVSGRWPLEKSRYLFYAGQARQWLKEGSEWPQARSDPRKEGSGLSEEVLRLEKTEAEKLALTVAVEQALEEPRTLLASADGVTLAFWQSDPFVALILPASAVSARIWEPMLEATSGPDIALALVAPSGETVLGASPPAEVTLETTHDLTEIGLPLRLKVWPSNGAALYADLGRRQSLYLAMLGLVVALLAFGSYLTARTVRRELEVARLKSEFVSAVSHEFRSPLTGIRQLGEMLLRGRLKDEERRQVYYRMIVRESSRLTRLVENVLDFSRIEEGRQEYAFRPFEPGPWLTDVVESFRQEVGDKDFTIAADIPAGLPMLHGDREALTCAVHNLLDNATKYSAGSDTVWLEAEAGDESLSVRVRDQGVGISEEEQEHIFEKFFRVGGEMSEDVKGVGLGLSLVRHIVAAHGGSIGLESRLGEGSTFTIELPATPAAAEG